MKTLLKFGVLVFATVLTITNVMISQAHSQTNTGSMSWDSENNYWRGSYATRPYYNANTNYTLYEPAYRYGMDLYNQNSTRRFQDLDQTQLQRGWTQARGTSSLDWNTAQLATRDAYNRLYDNRHVSTSASSATPSVSGSISGSNTTSTTPSVSNSISGSAGVSAASPSAGK